MAVIRGLRILLPLPGGAAAGPWRRHRASSASDPIRLQLETLADPSMVSPSRKYQLFVDSISEALIDKKGPLIPPVPATRLEQQCDEVLLS